jgi:hypothetical protein
MGGAGMWIGSCIYSYLATIKSSCQAPTRFFSKKCNLISGYFLTFQLPDATVYSIDRSHDQTNPQRELLLYRGQNAFGDSWRVVDLAKSNTNLQLTSITA